MPNHQPLIDSIFASLPEHDAPGLSQALEALAAELLQWADSSPRFADFAERYHGKIRKKARVARDAETVLDLRAELAVARALLSDRRLTAAYEPYASAGGRPAGGRSAGGRRSGMRGPDFAVTYRANQVFNLEVGRLRGASQGALSDDPGELLDNRPADDHRTNERLTRRLLEKLGQMQPGQPNLLVVCASADLARAIDLSRLMQAVKLRAESNEAQFYAASRYLTPQDFYKDFLHLGGMLLWGGGVQSWVNKAARPALDLKALRLVAQVLEASASA